MPTFTDEYFWPSENRESGVSDQQETRKAPGALDPGKTLAARKFGG